MADYTAYPTADDVELLMRSARYWPADSDTVGVALAREQASIAAASVVSEFEERVGWYPFLADAGTHSRTFDGTDQYGVLELDAGMIGNPESVTVSGQPLTVNVHYYMGPQSAGARGKCFTHIRFMQSLYTYPGLPGRISVTGKWGFCSVLPAFVWKNIQEYAGVKTLMSIENLQSIGTISQDGFSLTKDVVGIIDQKTVLATWGKDFNKNFQPYIRVVC